MPTAFMSMLPRPCATGLLRPKRLFEVDGTTGGAPSSHCGLEARGGHGLPPATAPSIMPESAGRELQGGPPKAVEGARPERRRVGLPPPPCFAWSPSLSQATGGCGAATPSRPRPSCPALGRASTPLHRRQDNLQPLIDAGKVVDGRARPGHDAGESGPAPLPVDAARLETLSCGMAGLKIFVSYTSADRDWAHWIAWTLKEAGHEPFVHEWEIGAGENIPAWMERRLAEADRLIGVFSQKYTEALFSKSERTAAYWDDPMGKRGFLTPVAIEAIPKWPPFVAPLKRLSLVGLHPEAARAALIAFLEPPGPPKEAPKFPGTKPESRADEAAAFAEGGETLAPREPLFPPQERQLIGDVAQEKGVDPERLRPILENLGLADVPVDEIADKLREAVDALRAKADAPALPSNAGPDLDAARAKAGEKLRALDTDGALAVWDAFMAEDAFEAALRRRTTAMKEQAEILRLRYDHAEAAAVLREVVRLDPENTWVAHCLGRNRQDPQRLDAGAPCLPGGRSGGAAHGKRPRRVRRLQQDGRRSSCPGRSRRRP